MYGSITPDPAKSDQEAKGEKRASTEPGKLNDPGGQSEPAPFRQTSRSENVQHYPQAHTYVTPIGNYGHPQAMLNMGNLLPGYPAIHTQFNQQNMQQQSFVPTPQDHGLMYGMSQFPSFPASPTRSNMIFGHPYSQMYIPCLQHQQQHQGIQIPDTSGFRPLATSTPGALGGSIPYQTDAVSQSYYRPTMYSATRRHQARAPDLPYPSSQPRSGAPRAHEDGSKENQNRITIVDGSTHMRPSSAVYLTSRPPKPTTPKGPPRKPKQSGNALWVGNLAPGTSIVELKDHFSQGATKDLESVFVISRSNCAFVNYKTEEACLRALSRFHDSRLRGARLVCRLRRGLMSPGPHSEFTGLQDASSLREAEDLAKSTTTEDDGREGSYSRQVPNRYFILKSLTVEDLEISRQRGIWATQTHNEESLNRAFENADNVYLIFSANKSGEYYGYARMMSTIKEDQGLTLEMPPPPEHHSSYEPGSPDVIPAPASSSAPNGRIINDVARGTIFWEADTSEDEEGNPRPQKSTDQGPEDHQPVAELHLIGKPFRIRWLSTERVPFHRTRGLRNSWNANREVKIARDGTELEFSVGAKLVLLFHPESSG
ncbi:YT521-B-like domain-containing protein [Aspergillus egyptiacus]|nr:YT521-B-like domain-containing protein [Aspergillus egyptiacus]